MKNVKSIVLSLLVVGAFIIFNSPFASAATTDWLLSVSELSPTTTSKTLNVDFATMSIRANDSFTVDLYQNGSKVQTQVTAVTGKYGNTGGFNVTVGSDGAYNYTVIATNNFDSAQQSGSTVTTVNSVAPNTVTTIPTTTTAAVTTAAATTTGEVAGATATAATTKTGEVAGITAVAGDANNSVTKVAGTKVLGMSPAIALSILAAILLAVGAGWYIIGRMVDNKSQ